MLTSREAELLCTDHHFFERAERKCVGLLTCLTASVHVAPESAPIRKINSFFAVSVISLSSPLNDPNPMKGTGRGFGSWLIK
jgi:hypothetical protein